MPRRVKCQSVEMRGRNACWKCRERRIRCTLEKPACSNCVRLGHRCQYGQKLLWREEALARGICFGRQGVFGQSPGIPTSSSPLGLKSFQGDVYFLNTTLYRFHCDRLPEAHGEQPDLEAYRAKSEGDGQGRASQRTDGRFDWALGVHQPSLVPSAEAGDSYLFDFFVTTMCPNLSNSKTENPYWEFIVPLSLSSMPLFRALLSWAAIEFPFANRARKDLYSLVAADYRSRALRGLRKEIHAAQGDLTVATGSWASILTTIIMLSANDIAETCSSAWVEHLSAAKVLCHMAWPRRPATPDRLRAFIVMWFASHDIMSRIAWARKTLFDPSEWFAGDDEVEIDPMIVCSRGLMQKVSAIGSLIMHSRSESTSPEPDDETIFTTRRNAIEEGLQSLNQRVSTSNDATDVLLQVAESKRLCALIYFYTCIDNATPSTPVIQGLTRRVIRILADISPKPSIIFSLFVVGTMGVCNEDDRRLVLDKFHSLIMTRCLATAIKARDITMDVWLDRDLGRPGRWKELVETKSKLLSLA